MGDVEISSLKLAVYRCRRSETFNKKSLILAHNVKDIARIQREKEGEIDEQTANEFMIFNQYLRAPGEKENETRNNQREE